VAERKKLIFAGVFAGAALALNWLIEGETSPFYEHFIWDVRIPNFWARLNTIPYTIALVFSSELVYLAVFLAQWLLIGLLFYKLLRRKPLQ
jgi:hypothetical protein